jgi:hypothetical protein
MNGKRWIPIAGLVILLLGGGILVLTLMNRPMGQTLTLNTPAQAIIPTGTKAAPTQTPTQVDILPTQENITPTVEAATPTATATEAIPTIEVGTTCGNRGVMRLLVIGLTLPTDGEVMGADAIRLVTIDFDHASATILGLPAVMWLPTPRTGRSGIR